MNKQQNIFKKLKYCLTLLLALFLVACSQQPDSHDSQGNPIRLSDYKGKWVIINYWATWCKPCLTEIPALNNLYQQNKNKVVVLGVSYDKLSHTEINKVVTQFSIRYPMLSTFPIQKIGVKNVSVLPTTFIITPQGQLAKTLKGPQTKKQFAKAINGYTARQ